MAKQRPNLDPTLKSRSRELRRDSTFPEGLLWSLLRNRSLGGLKFYRQHPIGPFVADFYCAAASLVVELDGESHVGCAAEDERRTRYLAQEGFKVVRFTNDEVLGSTEAVATAIARAAGLDW